MPGTQQVTIQCPHPLQKQAPSKEEEIIPLNDGPVMDTYNLTYEELHKNIVQVRKKHFLDDLASVAFIKEKVIVTNTIRNPRAIATANLAFAGASKSNTNYLMDEKKKLIKKFQASRQEVEQIRGELQNAAPIQVYLE